MCEKISEIATRQTLQLAKEKCTANDCFDVQKKRFWREINAFSPQFYHKWIKIMLIRRKRKYHETCFKIYRLSSLLARSSSLIGLDIIITKLAINRKDMTQLSILSCILVCTACFDTC